MGIELENNFHKYCKIDEIDFNTKIWYNCVKNLSFIVPNYVIELFKFIESKNNNDNFSNFLKYFENNY